MRKVAKVPMKHQKKLPFYRDKKGYVGFNPRPGVSIEYGVVFDKERGYRVFFNYEDTPHLKNTWGTKSLRQYLKESMKGVNPELDRACKIYIASRDLADDMQHRREKAGRPSEGVPEYEGKPQ